MTPPQRTGATKPASRRRWLLLPALLLLAFGAGFAWFLVEAAALPETPLARTDAIVVLTGGAERVETGLRLLDEGAAPLLLVSGAAARLTLAEFARAHGRDPARLAPRVALGRAAVTTIGNADETAAFARARGLSSLRIVTAGYHMPRAMLELRRTLPDVRLVPHPIQPAALRDGSTGAWRSWTLRLGEYVKLLAAAVGLARLAAARDPAPP